MPKPEHVAALAQLANARYPHKRIPLGIYPAWTRRQISAEYAMVASEVRP